MTQQQVEKVHFWTKPPWRAPRSHQSTPESRQEGVIGRAWAETRKASVGFGAWVVVTSGALQLLVSHFTTKECVPFIPCVVAPPGLGLGWKWMLAFVYGFLLVFGYKVVRVAIRQRDEARGLILKLEAKPAFRIAFDEVALEGRTLHPVVRLGLRNLGERGKFLAYLVGTDGTPSTVAAIALAWANHDTAELDLIPGRPYFINLGQADYLYQMATDRNLRSSTR